MKSTGESSGNETNTPTTLRHTPCVFKAWDLSAIVIGVEYCYSNENGLVYKTIERIAGFWEKEGQEMQNLAGDSNNESYGGGSDYF